MLSLLNANLKEKPTIRTGTLFNKSLPERLNQSFICYLEEFNQDNKMKELAKKINWKSIIQIYKNECNDLRAQFLIPKVIDEINVKDLDIKLYSLVIQTTLHSLLYYLYLLLKSKIASNKPFESLDYDLTKYLSPVIRQFISSYYFQLELTRIIDKKENPVESTEVKKFKELANLGGAFAKGKSFEPKEIPVFRLILQEYVKASKAGIKKSYKAIAYFLAKNELELLTREEQYRFYKRFLSYKNNIQK
jgi:hypothetical protein